MQQQDEIINEKENKKKATHKISIFLLVLVAIGLVYGYFWNTSLKWNEETEDAYVNSHQNLVNSQVSGNVIRILVDDTQPVKKGQLIAEIDKTDYMIALSNAKVELEQAIRKYYTLTNNVSVAEDTLNAKKTEFLKNEKDYKRDTLSYQKGLISKEDYDIVKNNYEQSQYQYSIAKNNYINDKIQAASKEIKTHPDVEKNILNYKKAFINLNRTNIYATFDGIIAKRSIFLGQKVNESQNLFTIVDLNNSWVDANLKETQLKNLKIGQSVEITSDINKKVYEGIVKGVSAGSGSAFSLLPAQNATGNWIKVVQRVPVKIDIEKESLKKNGTLPIGSSVIVNINTHEDQSLKEAKPAISENTTIYNTDEKTLNENVDNIFKENLTKLNQ